MSAPFEIIASPFTVWWAPVGEAFPAIDATPGGNWAKIGTSGDRNYSDDGVTIQHEQSIEKFRGAGSTGPQKVVRTEEDLMVRFELWDISLEQYRLAMNSNAVTTTAAGSGTAGHKVLNGYRGLAVAQLALLIRGPVSAYGDGWNSQYEIPVAYQSGNPEPVLQKGSPAALALEFTALEDPNAATEGERFGRLKVQHQTAL